MYVQITKSLLTSWPKPNLLTKFNDLGLNAKQKKAEIVELVMKAMTTDDKLNKCKAWFLICPFCRKHANLKVRDTRPMNPKFCVMCGRTTPYNAFCCSLSKTEELIILASKMNQKNEKETKTILLEQCVVAIITGIEVLMREAYSIAYDHKHVVMGNSVYEDTYTRTRNEFLNLGSANRWLIKILELDLRKIIKEDAFKFLSRMYSARHIIVHNSSIKDREFISQTGDPETELKKHLQLNVHELRKLAKIALSVGRRIDSKLEDVIISFQQEYLTITTNLKSS
jgi:hypothetical protein